MLTGLDEEEGTSEAEFTGGEIDNFTAGISDDENEELKAIHDREGQNRKRQSPSRERRKLSAHRLLDILA